MVGSVWGGTGTTMKVIERAPHLSFLHLGDPPDVPSPTTATHFSRVEGQKITPRLVQVTFMAPPDRSMPRDHSNFVYSR
jgi:hypothetical protein